MSLVPLRWQEGQWLPHWGEMPTNVSVPDVVPKYKTGDLVSYIYDGNEQTSTVKSVYLIDDGDHSWRLVPYYELSNQLCRYENQVSTPPKNIHNWDGSQWSPPVKARPPRFKSGAHATFWKNGSQYRGVIGTITLRDKETHYNISGSRVRQRDILA